MKRLLYISIISVALCWSCGGADNETTDSQAPDSTREVAVPLKVSKRVGNLATQFKDLNDAHLEVASRVGIKPMESLRDVWYQPKPLEEVTSCSAFMLDSLTHSFPYLTPGANELLHDIGTRFNDTLQARGGGNYRIIVTSVLRTAESVKRLKRRNVNSTQNSAHLYGTTFDISYVRFDRSDSSTVFRTDGDLKNLLAEILMDLRDENRCLVKFERKQGCFHITSKK